MAARSNRTGELTTEDLVAMFGDERRTLHLECGQVLFKNGDTGGSMFVVRSGTLTIRSGSVVYEDVGPGGMVGEMGIVESNMPRSAMVYALTPAELVEVVRLSLVPAEVIFTVAFGTKPPLASMTVPTMPPNIT